MPAWTTLVSVDDLRRRITDPNLVVLDVRHKLTDPAWGPSQYRQGHLPGAQHAHIDHDLASKPTPTTGRHPLPSPEAFRAACGRWGIDDKVQVVAYDDQGGIWAARAWWLLQDYGHKAVALLDGGIQAWLSAGLPPESSIIDPVPRTFRGKPGHRPQAEAAQILDARGSVLLDARAPERYRGEQEPIDPVAGHIPGARNLPAVSLVGADMRLKPAAELRVLLSAAGAAKGTSATAYCGSGVTSALLVLAAEVAGVGPMRLYPGSWSEWIRDPKRPIAKGDE